MPPIDERRAWLEKQRKRASGRLIGADCVSDRIGPTKELEIIDSILSALETKVTEEAVERIVRNNDLFSFNDDLSKFRNRADDINDAVYLIRVLGIVIGAEKKK